MLKISVSISADQAHHACIQLIDSETGYTEMIRGPIETIRKDTMRVLRLWRSEKRGNLQHVMIDYYARYAEHEAMLKLLAAGWAKAL